MNEDEVQQRRRQQDEASTEQRSRILGLKYLDMRPIEETLPLARDLMTIEEMHNLYMLPLTDGNEQESYQFAVTTQTPQSVIQRTRRTYQDQGLPVEFYLISLSAYRVLMNRFDPPKKIVYDDIKIAKAGDSETIAEVSQTLGRVSSEEVFDFLINQADMLGASDIHIENERHDIRIRLRVDGALHPVATISRSRYRVIMGELASRAGVSSASMEPQSGHIQKDVTHGNATHLLNIRVETVPTMYGQDAVLRLFNFDESLLNLDLLGIPPKQRQQIDEIITLEDPIEYGLAGISQIPINTTAGGSFGEGLRSVLRLDPDVVMVGEIRDVDTARTAIQASITGHLVMSSFHANSSSAAFSRMIDLIGVNPIFASAIRLVVAQRLVRRLVDETKEAYEPDDATRSYVKRVLADIPEEVEHPDLDTFKLWRPVPSDDAPFGYKGRMVIMEQLIVTPGIQKFIRGDFTDVHPDVIEKAAQREGMLTLEQIGVLAALRGETTLEEVGRVI